jgi:Zn-dependent protease with chaperone function
MSTPQTTSLAPVIEGYWHPPHSAARAKAILVLNGEGFHLEIEEADTKYGSCDELRFSDRVGNIHRHIYLPDGSVFITGDNDGVDALLASCGHAAKRMGLIHRLESRGRWVFTALVATILISVSFVWWGVPLISAYLAASMPASVNRTLGSGTLESMDSLVFEPSKLAQQQRQEIATRFQALAAGVNHPEYSFTLHFRQMHGTPNAFALPSGDVVITDSLIKLADTQEEIDSVLLHEIGHIIHRHGLEHVIYSTANTVMISLLLGDATAISDLAVALPTFLLNNRYSREHEAEADTFALEAMISAGIDPKFFADIMEKMMTDETQMSEKRDRKQASTEVDDRIGMVVGWLSTHPETEVRIQRAKEYSQRFVQTGN